MSPLTRRRLLASAGAGAAGLGLGGATGFLVGKESAEASSDGTGTVPFHAPHQAGIATPAQDRLHFAAFDLVTENPDELRELMRAWSAAAAEMAAGQLIGDVNHEELAPPEDTGETVGLLPANLTITFGFGPGIFERRGLGLSAKRPAALRPLPPLPGDELAPDESGGDLCVQACADDPQVVFHAIRNLARIGRGTVRHALVATRLRPHLEHEPQPGDAPQPDGDEGRHRQHPRRGRRSDGQLRLARRR